MSFLIFFGCRVGHCAVICDEPEINSRDSALWSSWSPPQRQVYAKLGRVIARYVKNIDGSLQLVLPDVEFRKMNLPDTMSERLVSDLAGVNRWMDSTNMPTVERVEMCDDYIATIKQFVVNFDAFCKAKGFPTDWEQKP